MLAALSTGHQIGLGVSGLAFVVFALTAAMLVPRRRPDFPGDKLGVFVAVCFVFFVGMLAAVFVFGKESSPPEKHNNEAALARAL